MRGEIAVAKEDTRFVKTLQGTDWSGDPEICGELVTGVNYLFHSSGYAGGLTPLLNRDGTPVITTVFDED